MSISTKKYIALFVVVIFFGVFSLVLVQPVGCNGMNVANMSLGDDVFAGCEGNR